MDERNLSHMRWDRKYHIVFSPKFRREAISGQRNIQGKSTFVIFGR